MPEEEPKTPGTQAAPEPRGSGRHTPWFWRRSMGLLWGMVLGLVALAIYWPGVIGLVPGQSAHYDVKLLRGVDLRLGDWLNDYFGWRRSPEGTPRICVVGLTEEGEKQYGKMPWPRSTHAMLVRRLHEMGAKVVAFDIFFSRAGDQWQDAAFARACREAGNVILPRWADLPERVPHVVPAKGGRDRPEMKREGQPVRAMRRGDVAFRGPLEPAAATIYASASQVGHINVFYDDDFVARRLPVAVGELGEKEYYLPLGIVAAMAQRGMRAEAALVGSDALVYGDVRIPLDETGCILVNYQPFDRFIDLDARDHLDIESDVPWLRQTRKRAPAEFYTCVDVLEGEGLDDAFKGALVLVGQAVDGSREDVHITPYGSKFGVFVQAMLLHTALTERFLVPASQAKTVIVMLAFSVLLGTFCFGLRFGGSTYAVVAGGILLLGLLVVVTLCAIGILRRGGLVVEATPFLLVIGLNLAGGMCANAARLSRETERRDEEMDLLLAAGRRHVATLSDERGPSEESIPGAAQMAMALSASLSQRSPEIIAETFFQTILCESCAVVVVGEEDPTRLDRVILRGFSNALCRKKIESIASDFARRLLRTTEPVTCSRNDREWVYGNELPWLRALLGVPITARGRILAVAVLLNKRATRTSPEKRFGEDDARVAAALRYQAAALLENARRHRLEYAMFNGFAQALAKAVDFRDRYTHGHSDRVAELSVAIGRELGLTKAEVEVIQRTATLHDVGKIGVSDAVLNKPGKLTDEEFGWIKAHAADGYEILKNTPMFEALLPGIRHHHERYDGRGYPDGLAGEEIPLIARIIAVADAYDAMTSHRVYREALPENEAQEELRTCSGSQFDAKVVAAFLRYLDRQRENRTRRRARQRAKLEMVGAGATKAEG